jgi:hypothetical protein
MYIYGPDIPSLPVRYGVPPGSIFGPLLFLLYTNDVLHLTQSRTVMFDDDTSILNIGKYINELQKQPQKIQA